MPRTAAAVRVSSCKCGKVRFEASGEPIVSVVCYCSDCQAGGALIEQRPGAPAVRDPDGGTQLATFHAEQWRCLAGEELIEPVKLKPDSPTSRYVAACCNSGMYLEFAPGYWVSTYRNRFTDPLPPLEWRQKLERRNSTLPFPDDLPRYRGFGIRTLGRLAGGYIGRLFGRRG